MPDGSRLPDFLIVGAAKCGTTSLAAWLAAHPDGFIAPLKEVSYFALDDLYRQGPKWYATHFDSAGDARAVGEATPNYMFYPWAVERIARDLPDVRLVVCLRNPADRAHSHFLHWRYRLMLEPRTFPKAIEDELADGANEVSIHQPKRKPPYFAYLARGRYAEQLERLEARFGRDRIHVVLLDDMRADPQSVYAGVCRFLGLDDTFRPDPRARENAYQRHRRDWLVRPFVRAGIMQRLPRTTSEWIVDHFFPPVVRPAPAPDSHTRQRMLEFFAPHNAALATRLGRDLSAWDR